MPLLDQVFDPNEVPKDQRNFDVLPPGWYDAHVVETALKAVKPKTDGGPSNGWMVVMTWEIMSEPYARRKVFDNVNYINVSEQAQNIGRGRMAAMCEAMDLGPVRDTDEYRYKPAAIKVSVFHDPSGRYEDKNEIKKVARFGFRGNDAGTSPINGAVAPQGAPPARPMPAQAAQLPFPPKTAPAASPAAPAPQPQRQAPKPGSDRPWG